ncbi:DUF4263 domain-containing protein [Klebsiella pneumoniae]
MISLLSGQLSNKECSVQLSEFQAYLIANSEIGETDLLDFFKDRPQLILLMGRVVGVDAPMKYNNELPIIGKYRADFVVSDSTQSTFSFIEFEDARDNSIFTTKINKKTSVYPWSARFEQGYSQVIDWYLHLAANNQSQSMRSEFGRPSIRYFGALVIGRSFFLNKSDCKERFDNRVQKSLIDSKHITCYTYDELYETMADQFEILSAFN